MTDLDLISDKPEPLTATEWFFVSVAIGFVLGALLLSTFHG
jgi:hypothetical protein